MSQFNNAVCYMKKKVNLNNIVQNLTFIFNNNDFRVIRYITKKKGNSN